MANTAYLVVSLASGNLGEPPPNAQVYADMVVKDGNDRVVFSQQAGASAVLGTGDTAVSIAAKLLASARGVMNDPDLQVVLL